MGGWMKMFFSAALMSDCVADQIVEELGAWMVRMIAGLTNIRDHQDERRFDGELN
jgi:hypothetical protein